MHILVTGGSGLVGTHIKDLVTNNQKFEKIKFTFASSKDCDLTNRNDVLNYFKGKNFSAIIHLAARVGGLYDNMRNNVSMFSENIKINENILEACNLHNIYTGIFCLSSCIFPANPSKFPMDETMIHESPPHPSNEGYAYAKRMLEVQCRHYNKTFGRKYICVVPVNLYGEYDNFTFGQAHVIPELIHRMYNFKKEICSDEPFYAYGTGKPLRQFLYAGDFAKMILNILFNYNPGHMNLRPVICCNDEITIKELVYKIAYIMEVDLTKIHFDSEKSDGCMQKTVTNNYYNSFFPEFNFTTLHDGLKKTIDWFHENYKSVRK